MQNIQQYFYNVLIEQGLSQDSAQIVNMLILSVILLVILFITDILTKKVLVRAFHSFAKKSTTNFDDILIENKAPNYVAHLVPLLLTIKFFPIVFKDFPSFEAPIETGLKVYGIVLFIWILRSILKTFEGYFKTIPRLKDKPIDSYIQVVMLITWIIGIAACFVIVTGISFWKFFTTLGAASAVLLLIFKDTILGFVASIQVAVNDTIRIGDWITMEKYGADGDVIEINLSTVQVQNFDKTITNIPT